MTPRSGGTDCCTLICIQVCMCRVDGVWCVWLCGAIRAQPTEPEKKKHKRPSAKACCYTALAPHTSPDICDAEGCGAPFGSEVGRLLSGQVVGTLVADEPWNSKDRPTGDDGVIVNLAAEVPCRDFGREGQRHSRNLGSTSE